MLCERLPASRVAQAGKEGGGAECKLLPSPLLRPSPSVLICSTLARCSHAAAVVVCFGKKTALSRGWCTPLTRGSAVCGAERIAQHANPGLLSSPVRLSAFHQNVIKRNQAIEPPRTDHPRQVWPPSNRAHDIELLRQYHRIIVTPRSGLGTVSVRLVFWKADIQARTSVPLSGTCRSRRERAVVRVLHGAFHTVGLL